MKKFLKWLAKKDNITVEKGGKHQRIIKYDFWERPYPIPYKNNEVNKHIVKALMHKLVESEICTKDEFDDHI